MFSRYLFKLMMMKISKFKNGIMRISTELKGYSRERFFFTITPAFVSETELIVK